jgi:hypothetical protein
MIAKNFWNEDTNRLRRRGSWESSSRLILSPNRFVSFQEHKTIYQSNQSEQNVPIELQRMIYDENENVNTVNAKAPGAKGKAAGKKTIEETWVQPDLIHALIMTNKHPILSQVHQDVSVGAYLETS